MFKWDCSTLSPTSILWKLVTCLCSQCLSIRTRYGCSMSGILSINTKKTQRLYLWCRWYIWCSKIWIIFLHLCNTTNGGDIVYKSLEFGNIQRLIERGGWYSKWLAWIKVQLPQKHVNKRWPRESWGYRRHGKTGKSTTRCKTSLAPQRGSDNSSITTPEWGDTHHLEAIVWRIALNSIPMANGRISASNHMLCYWGR